MRQQFVFYLSVLLLWAISSNSGNGQYMLTAQPGNLGSQNFELISEFPALAGFENRLLSPPRSGGLGIMLGIEGGLAWARYNLSIEEDEIKDAKYINGFRGGATIELVPANARGFSLLSGIFYRRNGSRIIDENLSPEIRGSGNPPSYQYWVDRKETLDYLSFPLLGKYTTKGRIGIQLVGGFEFGFGQSGKYKLTLKDQEGRTRDPNSQVPYNAVYRDIIGGNGVNFVDKGETGFGGVSLSDTYRRLSVGLALGFGIVWNLDSGGIISIRADYGAGLTNLFNDNQLDFSRKQSTLGINAGISFPIGG